MKKFKSYAVLAFILVFGIFCFMDSDVVTFNDTPEVINKRLDTFRPPNAVITSDFEGSFVTQSNLCPIITEAQRDSLVAMTAQCIFNSTTDKMNVFDGVSWVTL